MKRVLNRLAGAVLILGLSSGVTQAKDVLDAAVLETRMQSFLAHEVEAGRVLGGVALVLQDGEAVLLQSVGTVDVAGTYEMDTKTLFRIASMTKPIVSVAILQAVETGRIGLDDPIAEYLPELADLKVMAADGSLVDPVRAPSVYDLLRHTAGFTYSFAGAAAEDIRTTYRTADIEQSRTDMSSADMLQTLADIPLAFQPGTQFEYSIGIDLLGFILERVYDQPLDAVLKTQIFDPLAMTDTMFQVPADQAHLVAEAPLGDPMKTFTESWMRVAAKRDGGYLSGGGGLVSTAEDFARFAQMLLDDGQFGDVQILSPASVRLMRSNHINGLKGGPDPFTGPGYGFGLGLAMRLEDGGAYVAGAKGDANWSGLNGTTFTIDPENDLVAVFMAAAPFHRNHLRFSFRNVVYGALRAPQSPKY